jgi:predicted AAA+ superfamily ATPase
MIKRDIEKELVAYAKLPVVAILGPRQAGKTTLARAFFNKHAYVSFEDPDIRRIAKEDPRQFLRIYSNEHGLVIDEFQYVPEILSYIQLEVDEHDRPGYFILTGSQNFLMNQAITQSLAGRIGILVLSTLSIHELKSSNLLPNDVNELIFKGGYPRIYAEQIEPQKLYSSYIQTYIERDVRQLVNVGDLNSFQLFLKLCAGRAGQQLNLSELAGVCGVSVTTARRWISTLEASYVIFLLQPYFKNFNKRLTKAPKIYFYDTGLATELLGLESSKTLAVSSFKGPLFENLIIADLYKQFLNNGRRPSLYFWRDLNGRIEVDCLVELGQQLYPIEIKSGETVASDFFDALAIWGELATVGPEKRYVVYGGDLVQMRSKGQIVGWQTADNLIAELDANR